ncbi:MAG: nicotinate-nucleotide adenylyltransferase [Chloroflexota bacterium]|nr:nicotinate-nucleotide adenylyltransferase [Chloroflexota bacterium]
MNIGILGGTFDPIHIGHLILAEEARVQLKIDEVLFVPTGQPWLKAERSITPAFHRVEMVRKAITRNSCFSLCTLEIERPCPSYTVDTLLSLREQLGAEANFFFILGRDTLADLPLWKEPNKLIQMCRLAVASRVGPGVDLASLEASVPGIKSNIIQIDMPVIEISSSAIRKRVAQGLSIRYFVPEEVERYIVEQKLYG